MINTKLLKLNKEVALQTAIKKTIQQRVNETEMISYEGGLHLSNLVDFFIHGLEIPVELGEIIFGFVILD